MNTRFITNMALATAGVIIVVASQAFSSDTTGWITFGISLGVLTVLGAVQTDRERGHFQRGLDAASGALSVWAAVASVVYVGSTLTWLSLAEGLAFTLIATVGLIANEFEYEHAVSVSTARAEPMSTNRAEQYPSAA
jgi:hypothetical protein